jgi:hypothetical protein
MGNSLLTAPSLSRVYLFRAVSGVVSRFTDKVQIDVSYNRLFLKRARIPDCPPPPFLSLSLFTFFLLGRQAREESSRYRRAGHLEPPVWRARAADELGWEELLFDR